jgi:hypothetical protein
MCVKRTCQPFQFESVVLDNVDEMQIAIIVAKALVPTVQERRGGEVELQ